MRYPLVVVFLADTFDLCSVDVFLVQCFWIVLYLNIRFLSRYLWLVLSCHFLREVSLLHFRHWLNLWVFRSDYDWHQKVIQPSFSYICVFKSIRFILKGLTYWNIIKSYISKTIPVETFNLIWLSQLFASLLYQHTNSF